MFIANLRIYSPLLLLAALGACQHATLAPSAPANAGAVTGALSVPSVGPTPLAANAANPAKEADPSPFVEVARLGYAARLNVVGQRALLSTQKLLLGVHDDGVRIEPLLLEGLQHGGSQYPRVFGNMPESGWALQTSYEGRTSRSSLSRWTGSEWLNADGLLRDKEVIGISPWSQGRTLALLAGNYGHQLGFVQLSGARGAPLPELTRSAHNGSSCAHAIQPASMTALASGEVFLAGTRCTVSADGDVAYHGVVVEIWAPGQARGKVSVLPGLSEKEVASANIYSIVASTGRDVFVAGGRRLNTPEGEETKEQAYVAHFDGTSWRAFSAPPIDQIEELQRTPNGKLWALFNGELWTTIGSASESAIWENVVMPRLASEAGENAVSSFWVQDDERVWATLGSDDFSYLVRTQHGTSPLSLPTDEQVAQLSNAFDPMAAYQCESPTLVLLTLSRQAPLDADMPSVRAALRGHNELEGKAQFIELPFLTRRYLGVRGDLETLRATQEILSNANIPGIEPELRCLNSAPTRTLTIDFGGVKPELPAPSKARQSKSASRPRRTMDVDLF